MKKFLFLGLVLSLSMTFISAKSVESLEKVNDEILGRQCCSKTTYMADGSSVEITACAGWFLSNDANAMTRACAKVNEAMGLN